MINFKNENDLPINNIFDNRTVACGNNHSNQRGFNYGIYEFKVKLGNEDPEKWDVWPALWLLSVNTEIDLLDGIAADPGKNLFSGIVDWKRLPWSSSDWVPIPYNPTYPSFDGALDYPTGSKISTTDPNWLASFESINNAKRITCNTKIKSNYYNLSDLFIKYTVVWTPTQLVFFINGRELYTIPSSNITLNADCPLNIIASLQIHDGAINLPFPTNFYMDIDYIKVYKPKNLNYNLPFKSVKENIQTTFHNDGLNNRVNKEEGSIAVNPNDPNEIFYRGRDNYIYQYKKNNLNQWALTKLLFNDGTPILAAEGIKYNPIHDIILYPGENNRLNYFGRSNVEPCGFYHHTISTNYNFWWLVEDEKLCKTYYEDYFTKSSIEVANNGEIFYKGLDFRIHRFFSNGTNWNHEILGNNNFNELVSGDICIDNNGNSNTILYKGYDNRIHCYYKTVTGYVHAFVSDNIPSENVNHEPGSMVWIPALNGLLYRGTDNKLHLYYWDNTWQHSLLQIDYNYYPDYFSNYFEGSYVRGGLAWDNSEDRLIYNGFDGRLQYVNDLQQNGTCNKGWLDDNWLNKGFCSYNSTNSGYNSSSTNIYNSTSTNIVYYTKNENNPLSSFKLDNCTFNLPTCDNGTNPVRNVFSKISIDTINTAKTTIYPNPANDILNVNLSNEIENAYKKIYTIRGEMCMSKKLNDFDKQFNISILPIGIYIISIINNGITYRFKLVIER